MTSIQSVTLEAPDPTVANAFYRAAFGLNNQLGVRASDAATTGFRGFTLSLVVSQPATVLLGVADVAASKRFYAGRGLPVDKSFGRKYVQFATPRAEAVATTATTRPQAT